MATHKSESGTVSGSWVKDEEESGLRSSQHNKMQCG